MYLLGTSTSYIILPPTKISVGYGPDLYKFIASNNIQSGMNYVLKYTVLNFIG